MAREEGRKARSVAVAVAREGGERKAWRLAVSGAPIIFVPRANALHGPP